MDDDPVSREKGFVPTRDVSPLFAALEDKVIRDADKLRTKKRRAS